MAHRGHAAATPSHRGTTMSTVVVPHLVPIHLGIGTLHLHQLASDAEVLQSQDLLGRLGRVKRDETEPSTFLSSSIGRVQIEVTLLE